MRGGCRVGTVGLSTGARGEPLLDVSSPEAESSQRLVSAALLARVRPDAWFFNIGRGATVDQGALLEALEARRIAGAYLDVTDPEPLPPEHPLWRAPGCTIAPHTAGGRREEPVAQVERFLANLRRFERGEPLVDRAIWGGAGAPGYGRIGCQRNCCERWPAG
ncbi:NAD(P)-dependent oxidoreductase [Sorangium sp. So ce134]